MKLTKLTTNIIRFLAILGIGISALFSNSAAFAAGAGPAVMIAEKVQGDSLYLSFSNEYPSLRPSTVTKIKANGTSSTQTLNWSASGCSTGRVCTSFNVAVYKEIQFNNNPNGYTKSSNMLWEWSFTALGYERDMDASMFDGTKLTRYNLTTTPTMIVKARTAGTYWIQLNPSACTTITAANPYMSCTWDPATVGMSASSVIGWYTNNTWVLWKNEQVLDAWDFTPSGELTFITRKSGQ